jgi:hypothetical protein
MKKFPFHDGDWFAVPLRGGGFAIGVLARVSKSGVLFGYFFGPKRSAVPALEDTKGRTSFGAVLICQFGHLGLTRGTWPVLGHDPNWTQTLWPVPELHRHEGLTGKSYLVKYSDDDRLELVGEREVSYDEADRAPSEALFGNGAVEIRLTRLLDQ